MSKNLTNLKSLTEITNNLSINKMEKLILNCETILENKIKEASQQKEMKKIKDDLKKRIKKELKEAGISPSEL